MGGLYGCRVMSGVVSVGVIDDNVAVYRSSFLVHAWLLLFETTVWRELIDVGPVVAVHLLLAILCN